MMGVIFESQGKPDVEVRKEHAVPQRPTWSRHGLLEEPGKVGRVRFFNKLGNPLVRQRQAAGTFGLYERQYHPALFARPLRCTRAGNGHRRPCRQRRPTVQHHHAIGYMTRYLHGDILPPCVLLIKQRFAPREDRFEWGEEKVAGTLAWSPPQRALHGSEPIGHSFFYLTSIQSSLASFGAGLSNSTVKPVGSFLTIARLVSQFCSTNTA
jgi:hypothetical protein